MSKSFREEINADADVAQLEEWFALSTPEEKRRNFFSTLMAFATLTLLLYVMIGLIAGSWGRPALEGVFVVLIIWTICFSVAYLFRRK